MKYKYRVYGLNIESEIHLAAETVDFDVPDVEIKLGIVPELKKVTEKKGSTQGNLEEIVYNSRHSAKFYFKQGKEVIIEPHPNVTHRMIIQYLNGIGMSAILGQRGLIPIHGSAIKVGNKCWLILGHSGAGKSSLATALIKNGGKMLSDDVISIQDTDGQLLVYPSFYEQKVANKLVDQFDLHEISEGEMIYLTGPSGKHSIKRESEFCYEPTPIEAIIMLRKTDDDLSIVEVKGINKLDLIIKNVFRKIFARISGHNKEIFKQFGKIANESRVFLLSRPYGVVTIDQQIELIENALGGYHENEHKGCS